MCRFNLCVALLGALFCTSASAYTIRDYTTPEGMKQLHLCRAAVFYHLNEATRGESAIPLSTVKVMREQIEFVMQEAILNKSPITVAEGGEIIRFVEQFLIGFSEVLRTEQASLLDIDIRDGILHRCQPYLWVAVKGHIDYLLAWRVQAVDPPAQPDPQTLLDDQRREIEALLGERFTQQ
ncbi:MAG: hypothetical protein AAGC92_01745 [Pseudomonadota bacterium]